MDEIEAASICEPFEVGAAVRRISAKCDAGLHAEDRVVEVAGAAAIGESAIGQELTRHELPNQIACVTEQIRRQPRDLQHFESQTHCTNLALRERKFSQSRGAAGPSSWRYATQGETGWPAPCKPPAVAGSDRRRLPNQEQRAPAQRNTARNQATNAPVEPYYRLEHVQKPQPQGVTAVAAA